MATSPEKLKSLKASKPPTINELYWAAGFLEGEGNFSGRSREDGSTYSISCKQKQVDPLIILRCFFGGSIGITQSGGWNYIPETDIFIWRAAGARARGIAMTLYSLMSPRRKIQITNMLSV